MMQDWCNKARALLLQFYVRASASPWSLEYRSAPTGAFGHTAFKTRPFMQNRAMLYRVGYKLPPASKLPEMREAIHGRTTEIFRYCKKQSYAH